MEQSKIIDMLETYQKVNNYAMKLHPTCGALFSVSYVQRSFMIIFVFWLVASQSIC